MKARLILLALILLALTVPAFSQDPGIGPDIPELMSVINGPLADFEAAQQGQTIAQLAQHIATVLGDPSQAGALTQLLQNRQTAMLALRQQAQPAFQNLRALLSQQNPDPTKLAAAISAVLAIRAQRQAIQQTFEAGLFKLFPMLQSEIVQLKKDLPIIEVLRRLRVLGGPGEGLPGRIGLGGAGGGAGRGAGSRGGGDQ